MLEVHASMEEKAKSTESTKSTDTEEFTDISFEELLAQEKKDSFWFVAYLKFLSANKILILFQMFFSHCLSNYIFLKFLHSGKRMGDRDCPPADDIV